MIESWKIFNMLRNLARISALWALFYCSGAFAAGTVPGFSLTPQFDLTGKVMPGCKLYVIQAGTVSTPQNAYQDTGLSISQPNPLSCDASGRLPQWFVADGTIKLRLTTSTGVQIYVGDNLLVLGPSSGGGGGGGTVDPTTILSTGDFKLNYGTGILSGFVRANGRTIGSATSGATERANSDTQALFQYLWGSDPNLAVSGGRGVSAAADWAANKTIALPDLRGRTVAGLDDMGNTAAGRLTTANWGEGSASPTTLGAGGGLETSKLSSLSQIPQFTPSGNVTINFGGGVGAASGVVNGGNTVGVGGTNTGGTLVGPLSGNTFGSFTGNAIGSVSPASFSSASPSILMTIYIKL